MLIEENTNSSNSLLLVVILITAGDYVKTYNEDIVLLKGMSALWNYLEIKIDDIYGMRRSWKILRTCLYIVNIVSRLGLYSL
jgi:hypothetical protein